MHHARSLIAAATIVSVVSVAGTALAQGDADTAQAQAHLAAGHAAAARHDYNRAIDEFETGYRNKPMPVFLHDIAQTAELAGQKQKALDHYRLYLQMAPQASDRDEVQARIDALQQALSQPNLTAAPDAVVAANAPPDAAKKKRQKVIIAVSVVGAALVIGAVAVGVALGDNSNSEFHAWGTLAVTPH